MTVFIQNVPLDDVHSVLKLLYAPMYTHNVIAKKVLKPTFDPSRTGCQIEAEVGLFYRAHRKTTNGQEENVGKKMVAEKKDLWWPPNDLQNVQQ